jgi:hypothetical protein
MSTKELVQAQMPLMEKADKIFGKADSPAKQAFIDLRLMNGGLEPAVKLLGKQKEYAAYSEKFMALADAKQNTKAANLVTDFCEKITMQLALKFAIVNEDDLVPSL